MSQGLLLGFVEASLVCSRCHERHEVVLEREDLAPEWKCDRCRVRETRKRAPWRTVVGFEGSGRLGPAGGERLHFELECGHFATRIPYQRYVAMSVSIDPGSGDPQPKLRCYECDPVESKERER